MRVSSFAPTSRLPGASTSPPPFPKRSDTIARSARRTGARQLDEAQREQPERAREVRGGLPVQRELGSDGAQRCAEHEQAGETDGGELARVREGREQVDRERRDQQEVMQ